MEDFIQLRMDGLCIAMFRTLNNEGHGTGRQSGHPVFRFDFAAGAFWRANELSWECPRQRVGHETQLKLFFAFDETRIVVPVFLSNNGRPVLCVRGLHAYSGRHLRRTSRRMPPLCGENGESQASEYAAQACKCVASGCGSIAARCRMRAE
jgi:hypothetical protein